MAKSMKSGESKADARADDKRVKSGVHQHERALHKGKPLTKLKLGGKEK